MIPLNRAHELIQKYIDQVASDAEIAELDGLVTRHHEVAEIFAIATRHHSYLNTYFGEQTERGIAEKLCDAQTASAVNRESLVVPAPDKKVVIPSKSQFRLKIPSATAKSTVLPLPPWSTRLTAFRWRVCAALAACVAIGAGMYWMFAVKSQPRTEAIATITTAAQDATVLRGGETARDAALAGTVIQSGDTVVDPTDGKTVFKFQAEATTVELQAGAELKVWQDANGKRGRLFHGTIVCDVAKQPLGKPMVFTTPQARAEVVGTNFILSVTKDLTRLEVGEGKVRLTRTTDGQAAFVSTGEYAVADARTSGSLAVLPAESDAVSQRNIATNEQDELLPLPSDKELANVKLEDGEILFQDDFTHGLENWDVLWRDNKAGLYKALSAAEMSSVTIEEREWGAQKIKAMRIDPRGRNIVLALKRRVHARWYAIECLFRCGQHSTVMTGHFDYAKKEEMGTRTEKARPPSQEELATKWWRVRTEFCLGKDPQGNSAIDILHGFNPEKEAWPRERLWPGTLPLGIAVLGDPVEIARVVVRRLELRK